MSETDSHTLDTVILDTAARLFADLSTSETINAAEKGEWPGALWQAIEASGLHLTWVPEACGGAGAGMLDGFAVLKAAGAAALPVPLAETLLAGWLLAQAGLEVPEGPLTIARGEHRIDNGAVTGVALAVPHARSARQIVALARDGARVLVVAVPVSACVLTPDRNLAGEPWDTVDFNGAVATLSAAAPVGLDAGSIDAMGALVRVNQAAGALGTALELAIQYAGEREQFGRPIGKFQAIQHMIADLAGEAAAVNAAADAAAEAVAATGTVDTDAWVEIATAKVRLGQAASIGPAIAHQVHGAMGFTYEHRLHHFTRRAWAWRDEFGNETVWARRLGDAVLGWGADQLWPSITAVTDK